MNNDPADRRANTRRCLGLDREEQVTRASLPHPSHGGSRGYPVWFRREQLQKRANGEETEVSEISVDRWERRLTPFKMTGNKPSQQVIGIDQLLMSIYITIYPDTDQDEIASYIFNEGGNLYSNQTISQRLDELNVSRKAASTEAYQAFLPINLLKEELYFTRPPPLGIVGVERRRWIDVDEFGMSLERTNPKFGYSIKLYRVRKPGHYTRNHKLTVLYAIEAGDLDIPNGEVGSVLRPRRWINVLQNGGTTGIVFADFIDHICSDIEQNGRHLDGYPNDLNRIFMWDNLVSHHVPIVSQTVEARQGPCNFSSINRPPYRPKWGPIEYAICDLVERIADEATPQWTNRELENEIYSAAGRVGPFNATFERCCL